MIRGTRGSLIERRVITHLGGVWSVKVAALLWALDIGLDRRGMKYSSSREQKELGNGFDKLSILVFRTFHVSPVILASRWCASTVKYQPQFKAAQHYRGFS
jgi:hypothetical protein